MIRDAALILSNAQRVSAPGPTASTEYVDALAKGDAIKPGARIKIVSDVIFAGAGTMVTIALQTDNVSTFDSGALKTLLTTGAIAKAATAAGTVLLDAVIPSGVLRYLRVLYITDDTFETTGSVSAYIVLDTDINLDRNI